jgi:hypothetical protein
MDLEIEDLCVHEISKFGTLRTKGFVEFVKKRRNF